MTALTDRIAPVIVRILMRYLSGVLMGLGGVWATMGAALRADAELHGLLAVMVGAGLAGISEWLYARARATGGPT